MSQAAARGTPAAPRVALPFNRATTSVGFNFRAHRTRHSISWIGGIALLILADAISALAAPRLAGLWFGPTPTLAAGSLNGALYGAVTITAMLLAGLYGHAPARAPLDHARPLLRTLISAHMIVMLRVALIRPMPATPPLAGSFGWAIATFGLAALLILGSRLLIAAWWRRQAAAPPRGAAILVIAGPCDRALRVRLDRLTGRRLGYMFAWGALHPADLRMIADIPALEAMIRSGGIDDIVVFTRRTDNTAARDRIDTLLARLAEQPVRVHLAFDAVAEIGARGVAAGQSLRMVTVLDRPIRPLGAAGKRAADMLGAAILLVIAAPLMIVIALALRLGGPVLFRQRRTGRNGAYFTVLKFRTMQATVTGRFIEQARKGDARITRLGAVLRRFSLDELPQLFNVLRGDMSLVGPRPHAPGTSAGDFTFEQAIGFYGVRHRVKPGLTGLAQVRGLRGPTARPDMVAARVAADLDYIEHWSPWLDVLILLRTIPAVLGGRNAY